MKQIAQVLFDNKKKTFNNISFINNPNENMIKSVKALTTEIEKLSKKELSRNQHIKIFKYITLLLLCLMIATIFVLSFGKIKAGCWMMTIIITIVILLHLFNDRNFRWNLLQKVVYQNYQKLSKIVKEEDDNVFFEVIGTTLKAFDTSKYLDFVDSSNSSNFANFGLLPENINLDISSYNNPSSENSNNVSSVESD